MIDRAAIIGRLSTLFAETFHVDVPSADTDLLASGILDSLQLVELLLQIERHFDRKIAIDDIDLEDLRTLAGIAQMIAAGRGTADRDAATGVSARARA